MKINRTVGSSGVVLGMALAAGCASAPKQASHQAKLDVTLPAAPLNVPAGTTQTVDIVAGVLPLGLVPYDNMVLPMVSPCGRFIATQTGAPPMWSTALAEPHGDVPYATRVEAYRLDQREGVPPQERRAPELLFTVDQPLLLGRSCDAEGFLVESPREDGARWIGKVGWQTGEIKWLVTGEHVNAFASMGPGGRLAWSRRPIDSHRFELVVRGSGSEWSMSSPSEAGQWLFPTWSGRGDGIFVLHLVGDYLDLRYAMATSEAAFRQSVQQLGLASESTVHTAYQVMSGQSEAIDGALPTREQLVFFHPALQRVAMWRPLAAADRQRTHLNAKSVAALVDQEDFAFVTTPNHLIRQNLRNPQHRIELVAGTQVPRQTNSATWPYMLLSPGEGQVGVMAMRLLPREESIFGIRSPAQASK